MNPSQNLNKNYCVDSLDSNYQRYAGWQESASINPYYCDLWSSENLSQMQSKIHQLLEGCGPNGRNVFVPLPVIGNVITSVFNSHSPSNLGDIYTRFIIPSAESNRDDVRDIIDRSIEIVVTSIRNEYAVADANQKLSIWSTLYGDFNKEGLRGHAPIKVSRRRPQSMAFNMNY